MSTTKDIEQNKYYPVHVLDVPSCDDNIPDIIKSDSCFPQDGKAVIVVATDWQDVMKNGFLPLPDNPWDADTKLRSLARNLDLSHEEIDTLLRNFNTILSSSDWYERQLLWVSLLTADRVRNAASKIFNKSPFKTSIAQADRNGALVAAPFCDDLVRKLRAQQPVIVPGYTRRRYDPKKLRQVIEAVQNNRKAEVGSFWQNETYYTAAMSGAILGSQGMQVDYTTNTDHNALQVAMRESWKEIIKCSV